MSTFPKSENKELTICKPFSSPSLSNTITWNLILYVAVFTQQNKKRGEFASMTKSAVDSSFLWDHKEVVAYTAKLESLWSYYVHHFLKEAAAVS